MCSDDVCPDECRKHGVEPYPVNGTCKNNGFAQSWWKQLFASLFSASSPSPSSCPMPDPACCRKKCIKEIETGQTGWIPLPGTFMKCVAGESAAVCAGSKTYDINPKARLVCDPGERKDNTNNALCSTCDSAPQQKSACCISKNGQATEVQETSSACSSLGGFRPTAENICKNVLCCVAPGETDEAKRTKTVLSNQCSSPAFVVASASECKVETDCAKIPIDANAPKGPTYMGCQWKPTATECVSPKTNAKSAKEGGFCCCPEEAARNCCRMISTPNTTPPKKPPFTDTWQCTYEGSTATIAGLCDQLYSMNGTIYHEGTVIPEGCATKCVAEKQEAGCCCNLKTGVHAGAIAIWMSYNSGYGPAGLSPAETCSSFAGTFTKASAIPKGKSCDEDLCSPQGTCCTDEGPKRMRSLQCNPTPSTGREFVQDGSPLPSGFCVKPCCASGTFKEEYGCRVISFDSCKKNAGTFKPTAKTCALANCETKSPCCFKNTGNDHWQCSERTPAECKKVDGKLLADSTCPAMENRKTVCEGPEEKVACCERDSESANWRCDVRTAGGCNDSTNTISLGKAVSGACPTDWQTKCVKPEEKTACCPIESNAKDAANNPAWTCTTYPKSEAATKCQKDTDFGPSCPKDAKCFAPPKRTVACCSKNVKNPQFLPPGTTDQPTCWTSLVEQGKTCEGNSTLFDYYPDVYDPPSTCRTQAAGNLPVTCPPAKVPCCLKDEEKCDLAFSSQCRSGKIFTGNACPSDADCSFEKVACCPKEKQGGSWQCIEVPKAEADAKCVVGKRGSSCSAVGTCTEPKWCCDILKGCTATSGEILESNENGGKCLPSFFANPPLNYSQDYFTPHDSQSQCVSACPNYKFLCCKAQQTTCDEIVLPDLDKECDQVSGYVGNPVYEASDCAKECKDYIPFACCSANEKKCITDQNNKSNECEPGTESSQNICSATMNEKCSKDIVACCPKEKPAEGNWACAQGKTKDECVGKTFANNQCPKEHACGEEQKEVWCCYTAQGAKADTCNEMTSVTPTAGECPWANEADEKYKKKFASLALCKPECEPQAQQEVFCCGQDKSAPTCEMKKGACAQGEKQLTDATACPTGNALKTACGEEKFACCSKSTGLCIADQSSVAACQTGMIFSTNVCTEEMEKRCKDMNKETGVCCVDSGENPIVKTLTKCIPETGTNTKIACLNAQGEFIKDGSCSPKNPCTEKKSFACLDKPGPWNLENSFSCRDQGSLALSTPLSRTSLLATAAGGSLAGTTDSDITGEEIGALTSEEFESKEECIGKCPAGSVRKACCAPDAGTCSVHLLGVNQSCDALPNTVNGPNGSDYDDTEEAACTQYCGTLKGAGGDPAASSAGTQTSEGTTASAPENDTPQVPSSASSSAAAGSASSAAIETGNCCLSGRDFGMCFAQIDRATCEATGGEFRGENSCIDDPLSPFVDCGPTTAASSSSGNETSSSASTSDTCGNNVLDEGESCDEGDANSDAPNAACRKDCSAARCGDGIKDTNPPESRAPELCDDGERNSDTDSAACSTNCRFRNSFFTLSQWLQDLRLYAVNGIPVPDAPLLGKDTKTFVIGALTFILQ